MSLVLLVISLLAASVSYAMNITGAVKDRREAQEHAKTVQAAIRAYSLRNARLPCPAADRNGYENRNGAACVTNDQTGFVPYLTLGLSLPSQAMFSQYAVHRSPNADPGLDADLAVSMERTGDAPGEPTYMNAADLLVALMRINPVATVLHPYLTGDNDASGAMDCTANRVVSVAYWLIVPLTDADADGVLLDGSNAAAAAGACATYPNAPASSDFDDVVIAETPLQLAGWLKNWMQP